MMLTQREESLLLPSAAAVQHCATLFEDAQKAFAEGRFDIAQSLASTVWELLVPAIDGLAARHWRKPECSIVVVTYRAHADFAEAMGRIDRSLTDDCEVIVVDNGNDQARGLIGDRFPGWTYIDLGFNYGASGGRNVGLRLARGSFVLFLDDDGLTEAGTISSLRATIEANNAVAVRGRVFPKTPGSQSSSHYDLGEVVIPHAATTEGLAIYRREFLLEAGGFDALLYGHEGPLACTRLYRFAGPAAFLYDPGAVLLHDFAAGTQEAERKRRRYEKNNAYVTYVGGTTHSLASTLRKVTGNPRWAGAFAARGQFHDLTRLDRVDGLPPVSVISATRDVLPFVADYARSMKGQTHQDFQLVVVDDGSTDGSADEIEAAFRDDPRLTLIRRDGGGRGAALNAALAAARHEFCVIADADTVSLSYRLAASAMLLRDRELDGVSLRLFSDRTAYAVDQPCDPEDEAFRVRRLFGMPACFAAFAFRKSCFVLGFNETLETGTEADWLMRNLQGGGISGETIALNGVYCRTDFDRLSATERRRRGEVAMRWVGEAHRQMLGGLAAEEEKLAACLTGWEPAGQDDMPALTRYAFRLMSAAAGEREFGARISAALQGRLRDLALELAAADVAASAKARADAPAAGGDAAAARPDRNAAREASFRQSYLAGVDCYAGGSYADALANFLDARAAKPSSALAALAVVECLMALGRRDKAIEAAIGAIARNPDHARLRARLLELRSEDARPVAKIITMASWKTDSSG